MPAPLPPRFLASATAHAESAGRHYFRSATAASAISQAHADQQAQALARKRADAAAAGSRPTSDDGHYPYPERILVEPILQRIQPTGSDGSPREIARITRNSYTCEVLNAYDTLFVDIDTQPDEHHSPRDKSPRPHDIVDQDAALDALAALIAERLDLSFRIYATRAGLRYLCTSHHFDPLSDESAALLVRLKADSRYATLCRVQKCYRARLTPKPWRCTPPAPPPDTRGFFARLFNPRPGNAAKSGNPSAYATCHYLETVGASNAVLPAIAQIVQIHDTATEALTDKPLA